jgi:hypothetical protein
LIITFFIFKIWSACNKTTRAIKDTMPLIKKEAIIGRPKTTKLSGNNIAMRILLIISPGNITIAAGFTEL